MKVPGIEISRIVSVLDVASNLIAFQRRYLGVDIIAANVVQFDVAREHAVPSIGV